jgi:hypothetical protein
MFDVCTGGDTAHIDTIFRPKMIYYQYKISTQPKLLNVIQLLIFYVCFNITVSIMESHTM